VVQGDGIPLSDDSKNAHKNAHLCRRNRNRIVIPPAAVKAIVAQRGASVGGIGIRRKLPLTEPYGRRKYEMPASHSAVRRTLAGRGEPRAPLSKIAQRKERDTMRKRNRTITIRCTDDEYERIHSKAQRHKLSLSDFILRSAMDKKIIVADGLDEVAKQQKAIGRNLNQIAMLAHEGRLHSVRLDELIEQHRAVTQAVCDIAKEVK